MGTGYERDSSCHERGASSFLPFHYLIPPLLRVISLVFAFIVSKTRFGGLSFSCDVLYVFYLLVTLCGLLWMERGVVVCIVLGGRLPTLFYRLAERKTAILPCFAVALSSMFFHCWTLKSGGCFRGTTSSLLFSSLFVFVFFVLCLKAVFALFYLVFGGKCHSGQELRSDGHLNLMLASPSTQRKLVSVEGSIQVPNPVMTIQLGSVLGCPGSIIRYGLASPLPSPLLVALVCMVTCLPRTNSV